MRRSLILVVGSAVLAALVASGPELFAFTAALTLDTSALLGSPDAAVAEPFLPDDPLGNVSAELNQARSEPEENDLPAPAAAEDTSAVAAPDWISFWSTTGLSDLEKAPASETHNRHEPAQPHALPLPRARPELTAQNNDAASSHGSELQSAFKLLEDLFSFVRKEDAEDQRVELPPRTALYDISARRVFMPDGRRFEAHSGIGEFIDDVRNVDRKMRGPTPPNTYRIALREAPFHGVKALRLIPQDSASMYGRNGILAHPYMLGPDGSSNGCVSIREYDAFLSSYIEGKIDRLIVVKSVASAQNAGVRTINAKKYAEAR